jgi:ectoine hydroxylase-related dioxygenase (phytanoyl-CoA dioxygenase family)
VRLHGVPGLNALLDTGSQAARIASFALGPRCFPVRAILFDKSAASNWALGWHQDRTVAVRARRDAEGFGPWTIKQGLPHVAPPVAVLAGMATLRIHLDPVPPTNAPLLVAPGSHRCGMVPENEIENVVAGAGTVACLAERGDIWLYATFILHASASASEPRRRRVLQVDYANAPLPSGLEWLGL